MYSTKPCAADKLTKCRHCPRLRHQFKKLKQKYPDYWNHPVAPSGNKKSRLLIVGLAPGLHGANKTGQPFKGDSSGNLLFKTLTELQIEGAVRITNAVKCLPVSNKPSASELSNCRKFLIPEITDHLAEAGPRTILALGQVSHRSIIKSLDLSQKQHPFTHGARYELGQGRWLVCSYHCSRYNTQTGRLTGSMFYSVVKFAADLAGY